MPRTTPASPSADAGQLSFGFVPEVIPQGDGSYRVIPGKPVIKVKVSVAARKVGMSVNSIYRLCKANLVAFERPSPKTTFVFLESLEAHLARTRDDEFWSEAKLADYRKRALRN